MCYFDTEVFEDCTCKQWGPYNRPCARGRQPAIVCEEKLETFHQELRTGKCERCQEFDAITQELEKTEHELSRALAEGRGSTLKEVNSAVYNVYDELLNMRMERRTSKYNQETPGDVKRKGDNWYFPGTGSADPDSGLPKRQHLSPLTLRTFRVPNYEEVTASEQSLKEAKIETFHGELPAPSNKIAVQEFYSNRCIGCLDENETCVKVSFSSSCERCFDMHVECQRSSNSSDVTESKLESKRRVWHHGDHMEGIPSSDAKESADESFTPEFFSDLFGLNRSYYGMPEEQDGENWWDWSPPESPPESIADEDPIDKLDNPHLEDQDWIDQIPTHRPSTFLTIDSVTQVEDPESIGASKPKLITTPEATRSVYYGVSANADEEEEILGGMDEVRRVSSRKHYYSPQRGYWTRTQIRDAYNRDQLPNHLKKQYENSLGRREPIAPLDSKATDSAHTDPNVDFMPTSKQLESLVGAPGSEYLNLLNKVCCRTQTYVNNLQAEIEEFGQGDPRSVAASEERNWAYIDLYGAKKDLANEHVRIVKEQDQFADKPENQIECTVHVGDLHIPSLERARPHNENIRPHDLKIFKTHTRGFRNGLHMCGDSTDCNSSVGQSGRLSCDDCLRFRRPLDNSKDQIGPCLHQSRSLLHEVNTRFLQAAKTAHKKLRAAAYSDRVSASFRRFYNNLGELDDIIQMGLNALEKFFGGEKPRSLNEMYSFLHVAYAMSQSESSSSKKLDEATFGKGISVFKYCLRSEPESQNEPSEQDLFDEIVKVMWTELNSGLAWIKEQRRSNPFGESKGRPSQADVKALLKWSSIQGEDWNDPESRQISCSRGLHIQHSSRISRTQNTKSKSPPSWESLARGVVVGHIIRFLKSLDEIGIVFFFLCGTWCSSISSVAETLVHSGSHTDRGPTMREPPTSREMEVQDHIFDKIIAPLKNEVVVGMGKIVKTARYMLRAGPLTNIPDFEEYLVGLIKVQKRPKQEFLRLVETVLSLCLQCSDTLPARCRQQGQLLYTKDYIGQRYVVEECWYNALEGCGNPPNSPHIEKEAGFDTIDPKSCLIISSPAISSIAPSVLAFHSEVELGVVSPDISREELISSSQSSLDSSNLFGFTPNASNSYLPAFISPPNSPTLSTPDSISSFLSISVTSTKRSAPSSPAISTQITSNTSPTLKNTMRESPKRRRLAPEDKPYACEYPECTHRDTTEANLKRHHMSDHGDASVRCRVCVCDFPGCAARRTGARAKENIKTHKKAAHGISRRK